MRGFYTAGDGEAKTWRSHITVRSQCGPCPLGALLLSPQKCKNTLQQTHFYTWFETFYAHKYYTCSVQSDKNFSDTFDQMANRWNDFTAKHKIAQCKTDHYITHDSSCLGKTVKTYTLHYTLFFLVAWAKVLKTFKTDTLNYT